MTKVIFRKEKDGGILAVFPIYWDYRYNLMCYAHIGQHGGCSLEYYREDTKPAKSEDYAPLLEELRAIGYDDLQVCKRLPALSKIERPRD